MTLTDLIYECGELPDFGPRVQLDIRGFINRAITQIAQRKNWTFLHDYRQVTIPGGDSGAPLGTDFKELGPEKSPVSINAPGGSNQGPWAVNVVTRAQMQRWGGSWGVCNQSLTGSQMNVCRVVFIEQNADGQWSINVALPLQEAITYNISGYYFPAALVLGTDTNGVTNDAELCDAIINRTKAIAYSSFDPTDERAAACQQLYELHYQTAAKQDSRRRIAGVSWHGGGNIYGGGG